MNFILLTTTIIITNVQSAHAPLEYMPSVPQLIADIFSTVGEPCSVAEDCYELFAIATNMTAEWRCVNKTQSSNTTMCQFFECSSDDDCNTYGKCYTINKCDSDNIFYDEYSYSTICYANNLCDTIKTETPWTADTMCFTGSNAIYYSAEEAIICGKEEECLQSEPCLNTQKTTNCNSECVALLTIGISALVIGLLFIFYKIFKCKKPPHTPIASVSSTPPPLPIYSTPPSCPRTPTKMEEMHIEHEDSCRGSEEKEAYGFINTINNAQNEDGTRTSVPLGNIDGVVTGVTDSTKFENEILEDLFETDY